MCGEAARSAPRREGEDHVIAEKWSGCCEKLSSSSGEMFSKVSLLFLSTMAELLQ